MLIESNSWLKVTTPAGLWQLLRRLHISYKRGRDYVHSPDHHYAEKVQLIEEARQQSLTDPERYVFLYLDELTFYRQPTLACAYEASGAHQPLARRSQRSNSAFRVVAALNALDGRLLTRQRSHINRHCLARFWYDIRQAYPQAALIYVVLDNWPVHFHADALAPLQAQHFPFPPQLPTNWPTLPTRFAAQDNLPIQLLCLPTYASWLNPIEKLWRRLKQEVLHLHRLSDDWPTLKQRVADFLNRFAAGSDDLLRYIGLLPM
jgi:hypothetical protein